MALAVRQVKVAVRVSGALSTNNTFASAVLSGSLLVAHTSMWNGGGTGESVLTDNVNGAWGTAATTGYFSASGSDSELQLNAFPNSGAGTITVTSNPPGSSADIDLTLMEVTDVTTSAPRDKTQISATSTIQTTGTLAQADEILIHSFSHEGGTTALVGDTADAFTQADENESNSTGQAFHLQYKIVAATTSVTVNGTVGGGPGGFSGLASYKAGAPAGGKVTKNTRAFPLGIQAGYPRRQGLVR